MRLRTELVRSPIGIDPMFELSQFLRIRTEAFTRVVKANCYTCPFSFLAKCFSNESMTQSRLFLLAFFGLITSPHRKNAIDPFITWVVKNACVYIYSQVTSEW